MAHLRLGWNWGRVHAIVDYVEDWRTGSELGLRLKTKRKPDLEVDPPPDLFEEPSTSSSESRGQNEVLRESELPRATQDIPVEHRPQRVRKPPDRLSPRMRGKHHESRDASTNQRRRSKIPVFRRPKTPENRGRPTIREPRKATVRRTPSAPRSAAIQYPQIDWLTECEDKLRSS